MSLSDYLTHKKCSVLYLTLVSVTIDENIQFIMNSHIVLTSLPE